MKQPHRLSRTAGLWLAAAALAALAACSHKAVESVATEEEVPVGVKPAKVVDTFEATIAATGVIAPAPGADQKITAPQPARIAELPKAEGDTVKEGDLLVRFEVPTVTTDLAARESDVAQATARLNNAKAQYTRMDGLVKAGINAQKDLEAAKMEQDQAQATLQQAQKSLEASNVMREWMTVRARFPGVVAKRMHNVGDLVDASASDLILEVIDPNRLDIVASIAFSDLSRVAGGHAARIQNPVTSAVETATVVGTPAAVDPASATADVRLRFDKPTHLTPGTPVSLTIVAERKTKVLVVPTVAILRDGDDVFVMVAGQDDDKAHKTTVTTGISSGDLTEIKTGLKADDLVIVRGQNGLPDDADIVIVK